MLAVMLVERMQALSRRCRHRAWVAPATRQLRAKLQSQASGHLRDTLRLLYIAYIAFGAHLQAARALRDLGQFKSREHEATGTPGHLCNKMTAKSASTWSKMV